MLRIVCNDAIAVKKKTDTIPSLKLRTKQAPKSLLSPPANDSTITVHFSALVTL